MPVLFQQPQAELDCVTALDAMAAREAANNAAYAEPEGEEANIRFALHACAEQEEVEDQLAAQPDAEDEQHTPFPDGLVAEHLVEDALDEHAEELVKQAAEHELAEKAEAHDAHAEQAWYEGQEATAATHEQFERNAEWEEAHADALEMVGMLQERYAEWDEEKKRLDEADEATAHADGGNSDEPEEAQGGICSS